MTVRIAAVGTAFPACTIDQGEAAALIGRLSGDERRARALARATRIARRHLILPPAELVALGDIEQRNEVYRREAPALATRALRTVLPDGRLAAETFLVTSSCTGYALPGWHAAALPELGLPCTTMRVPLTEAGCAGGVLALATAARLLRGRDATAFAAAVELCTLSFHAGGDDGNLTATLIFGDGAGAARLETGPGPGLEIVDSASLLVPGTAGALGFDLRREGFVPVLSRELAGVVAPAACAAIVRLLARHGLALADVGSWLVHPGGAAILTALARGAGLAPRALDHSWTSLRERGNSSSAAIFDVIARAAASSPPPGGWALVAAFGPGVAVELLLGRWREEGPPTVRPQS